jgi:hypothetical protein
MEQVEAEEIEGNETSKVLMGHDIDSVSESVFCEVGL